MPRRWRNRQGKSTEEEIKKFWSNRAIAQKCFFEKMRVAVAASRPAVNKEMRENQLEQTRVAAAACRAAESEKLKNIDLESSENVNGSEKKLGKSAGYTEIVKDNEKFIQFYSAQGIVPEDQWEQFVSTLKENLPSTFRITGCKSQAKALLKIIQSDYFSKLVGINIDGKQFEDPICLPWYPENLAWQLNLSRNVIRRNEAFERLHNFLISETECGGINRQESVSMIPPLLLDVKPHHTVLDMCAAPGSKTAQLIEMLHSDDDCSVPSGLIVANDADNKRCYMLVHQAKRLQSPCLVITNHDAGAMPNISLSQDKQLKFDRILCDVPCSGDGTLRKNADIWMKWNVAHCLNFFGLQTRIVKRGLELLKVGGLIVYSTCSFCPYEDEAVMHHILSICNGAVELVDVADRLPGLKYVNGLSHWKVMNRELEEIVTADDIPEKNRNQMNQYLFPPSVEDAPKYNLHRCLRILPHLQNTGGFFVAVLQKLSTLPWETKNSTVDANGTSKDVTQEKAVELVVNTTPSSLIDEGPPRKRIKRVDKTMQGYREEPFFYFKTDEPLWPDIRRSYEIDEDFDHTLLLTRCITGKRRTLYFTSQAVKDVVTCNINKLRIINTGIKLFSRCDCKKSSPTEFRVTQEGIPTIMPYLKDRVVKITREDTILLLSNSSPGMSKLSETTRNQLNKYVNGSLVLIFEEAVPGSSDKLVVPLCAWKGATSLRAYVPKSEKLHFLRLCGVDIERNLGNAKDDADV